MHCSSERNGRRLRIVHVFRAPLGGLFRHVADLAGGQIARGHDVGMFFDSTASGTNVSPALDRVRGVMNLGAEGAPIRRNPHPGDITAFGRFADYLRRVQPDVVHGHGSKGGVYARFTGLIRSGGPARVYTPHGGSFNYLPGSRSHRLFMTAERVMARATDALLFESAYIAGRYDAFVDAPLRLRRVVHNGLDASEFRPVVPNADASDLLYVGELRAAKGIDTLLEALSFMKAAGRQVPRLTLVGSGPDRDMLIDRAKTLGIADRITFPGPNPARDAFAMGRVLVVPSRAESLPYVVLEAAAARVPMISTNVGGIPEIFGPFSDRLFACDNPAQLRAGIDAALAKTSEALAEEASDLAMRVAERFSLDSMVDAVIAAYREAIAARGVKSTAISTAASIRT